MIAYNDNGLKIIYPAPGWDEQLVADKDVPAGKLYKFIQASDLPSRETRNFWVMDINESNADGKGLTKEEFEAKYPEHKGLAVQ